MTDKLIGEPHYSRRIPSEWNGLFEVATAQVATTEDLTLRGANNVFKSVDRLGNEDLETNRYYGLGLAMCGLVKAISDPKVYDRVVREAARNISHNFRPNDVDDNLRLTDLDRLLPPIRVYGSVAYSVMNSLPRPTHVLLDSLEAVSGVRQLRHQGKDVDMDQTLKGIVGGRGASEVIANSLTAGATILMQRALRLQNSRTDVTDTGSNEPVIDVTDLRELDLRRVAVQSALLRIDEFLSDSIFSKLVEIDDHGTITFDNKKIPALSAPTVKLAFDHQILHTKRLGCPAVHVQGLIQVVLKLVPEIIGEAQETINWLHSSGAYTDLNSAKS